MANQPTATRDIPAAVPTVVFTQVQRGVFRSAGLWMMILGGIEVLAGGLMGLVFLLGMVGVTPQLAEQVFSSGSGGVAVGVLQCVATFGIGVITVIAGRSFRRASREVNQCLDAATTAVAELQDLYERQVWVVAIFVVVAVGTVILGR